MRKSPISSLACPLFASWLVSAAAAQPALDTSHHLGLLEDVLADTVTTRDGTFATRAEHVRLTLRPGALPADSGGENVLLAAFDLDGDGRDEILLGQSYAYPGRSLLLRGDGRGGFREIVDSGLPRYAVGAARGDLDNDGRCDLVIVGRDRELHADRPSSELRRGSLEETGLDRLGAYLARGAGVFTTLPVLAPAGGGPLSLAWPAEASSRWLHPVLVDVDRDGRLDLVLAESVQWPDNPIRTRELFWHLRNLGDRLEAVQLLEIPGGPPAEHWYAGGVAAMSMHDVDDDGWPDLTFLPKGGFFALEVPVLVFRNRDGRFAEQPDTLAIAREPRTFPPAWFDADADGDADLLSMQTDAQGGRHSLHLGDGHGRWDAAGARAGLWSAYSLMSGAAWGDLDQDGLPDLVPCLNAASVSPAPIPLLVNLGGGRFGHDLGAFSPRLSAALFTALCLDVDGDLDLDVLAAPRTLFAENAPAAAAPAMLYRNDSRGGRAVVLRLRGTRSNRSAIGAKVEVVAAGRRLARVVGDGGAPGTIEPPLDLHFGLGTANRTGLVTVRWPSGLVETWTGLAAGRVWTLTEGAGSAAR